MKKAFDRGRIDFLGAGKYLVPISILVMVIGMAQMMVQGLNYGIDFAGGTEVQVQFSQAVEREAIVQAVEKAGYRDPSVQSYGNENEYLIRLGNPESQNERESNDLLKKMVSDVTTALETTFASAQPQLRRVDSVGPQVGDELKRNGLLAFIYSLIIILIYIGLRFDYKYAPAAVFCTFFDAATTMALIALMGREVNVQTLAAILTLIGWSLNDTIVTFDRIRENETIYRGENFADIVNRAINDTLMRTTLTSVCTFVACLCLYFMADGTISEIGLTLGIGVIMGTYSSIYIASPLVILSDRFEKNRAEARMRRTAKV